MGKYKAKCDDKAEMANASIKAIYYLAIYFPNTVKLHKQKFASPIDKRHPEEKVWFTRVGYVHGSKNAAILYSSTFFQKQ